MTVDTSTKSSIEICILAAGLSTRLGRPKQLVRFRGIPLLRHVVQTALRIQEASLTVVTNRDVDRAGALTGLNINIIINEQPARGLGSSIKQAVAYSQAQGRQACLMLLGDQPFVGSDHLQRMIRLHHVHPDSIVASAYGAGGRGVPGLFPAAFYADLCAISDQEGAKEVIHSSPDIVMVELDQDALFDVDTPAHLVFLAERE